MYGHPTRGLPNPRRAAPAGVPMAIATTKYDYQWSFFAAAVFGLAVFGYESLAPLIELTQRQDSLLAVVLRALVAALAGIVIVIKWRGRRTAYLYLPFGLFILFYTMRLYDNFFIRELSVYVTPIVAFSFLICTIILPSIAVSSTISKIRESAFTHFVIYLALIFIIGMLLNIDQIVRLNFEERASLEKLNPISMASISSSFVLLFLVLFQKARTLSSRIMLVVGIILMSSVLLLSQSRGPFIALAISVLIYAIFASGDNRGRRRVLQGMLIVGVLLALTPFFMGFNAFEAMLQRMPDFRLSAYEYDTVSSEGIRLLVWRASIAQFLEAPLVGDVIYERALYFYPHNLFLEALISVGMLGTVFLVLHVGIALSYTARLLRDRRQTVVEAFVALCFIKFLVQAQFSGAVWSLASFWILSNAVIALGVASRARLLYFGETPLDRTAGAYPSREISEGSSADLGSGYDRQTSSRDTRG